MDLSKLSDDDLKALYKNDYKSISDDGLKYLKDVTPTPAPEIKPGELPKKEGPISPSDIASDIGTSIVGGAQVAGELAQQYPKTAAALGAAAVAALPESIASKIPVISPAQRFLKAPFELGGQVMENWRMNNINNLTESIRRAERFGQDTTLMKEQLNRLLNKLPAGHPSPIKPTPTGPAVFNQMAQQLTGAGQTAPAPGPVAPQQTVQRMALDKLKSFGRMAMRAAPALEALTYSPDLGPKVPSQGRFKGMEINPMTGRPWTPQELDAANRIPL